MENMKRFQIYEYLFYFGITSIKRNIKKHELVSLIDICNESCNDYADPLEFSRAITEAVFENKYISIDDLKQVPSEDIYEMFFQDELCNLSNYSSKKVQNNVVKTLVEPYIVKVGFSYEDCKKDKNIITGKGWVYYYDTEKDYEQSNESSIVDFSFKYNIDYYEIIDVECSDLDAKERVESNEDDFISNIVYNLLPKLEEDLKNKEDMDREMDK